MISTGEAVVTSTGWASIYRVLAEEGWSRDLALGWGN
jgi:hypothetical protein